jgi:hypothetical protein
LSWRPKSSFLSTIQLVCGHYFTTYVTMDRWVEGWMKVGDLKSTTAGISMPIPHEAPQSSTGIFQWHPFWMGLKIGDAPNKCIFITEVNYYKPGI